MEFSPQEKREFLKAIETRENRKTTSRTKSTLKDS